MGRAIALNGTWFLRISWTIGQRRTELMTMAYVDLTIRNLGLRLLALFFLPLTLTIDINGIQRNRNDKM